MHESWTLLETWLGVRLSRILGGGTRKVQGANVHPMVIRTFVTYGIAAVVEFCV
jgi:hypothetical protein